MSAVRFYIEHPERNKWEVFYGNIFPVKASPYLPQSGAVAYSLNNIPCESKRLGRVAYDAVGSVLSGALPVFVKRKDMLRLPRVVAISREGAAVYASDMRVNLLRNLAESHSARCARRNTLFRFHL